MRYVHTTALVALAAAGVLHLLAVPEHIGHLTIHGLFLLALGLAQLAWVFAASRRRSSAVTLLGLALSGGMLLLWGLLYSIPSPFPGHLTLHARSADWMLVATKVAEAAAFVLLLVELSANAARGRAAIAAGLAVAAMASLLWVAAATIETVVPAAGVAAGWPSLEMLAAIAAVPAQTTTESAATEQASYDWQLPQGFPQPRVPAANPMTPEKVELGRYLFYDPQLSGNGTQSCSSCHVQSLAFSDGKVLPTGSTGETLARNSPGLANVAYVATLTWANPVLTDIERQVLVPLFGEFPVEMGVTGHEEAVLARLAASSRYQTLFASAFPGDEHPINFHNVAQALASFIRGMISGASPYDRYLAGDKSALSPAARRGMEMFLSEEFECHHCHTGFNFSAATVHAGSTFSAKSFQNNGLYNLDGAGAYPRGNRGLYEITGNPDDMGRFRPPSLRNVALTAPYMHDGSIATLEAVIRHYADGGRRIEEGPLAGNGARSPRKSGLVAGFEITEGEIADLVAFLQSLTDREFIYNPAFGDPFAVAARTE